MYYLIVGLGNFGEEYEKTRHNCGFLCIDEILKNYNITGCQKKFKAEIYTCELFSKKVIIAKPQTYMNKSGVVVSEIKKFFKIPIENIFVFHDDLDLEFCKVKYKLGGGSAGHNGIKSISEMIGKNYHRVRIGIGHPEDRNVIDFVLKKFNSEELKQLNITNKKISDNLEYLFSDKKDLFINKFYLNKKNS